jgi:DNA invertase Pin-like site-specific DNA recombinase
MNIGYARGSTLDQTWICKCRLSERRAAKKIFREKVSGVSRERLEFQRMLDQLRNGDTVIVWKLNRLARSTRDLLETMETIREAGARFQSLSEPWANTTTHVGKLIMTVFAGIAAEFERDLRGNAPELADRRPDGGGFTLGALENSIPCRQTWCAGS